VSPRPEADTLLGSLDRAAAHRPEYRVGFLDRAEREPGLTWSEVRERALAVAGALVARGVSPGDVVGVVLPTGPEFFAAFFGALAAGAAPAPLEPSPRLGHLDDYHERTTARLAAAGARLLVTDIASAPALEAPRARVGPAPEVVVIDSLAGPAFLHPARPGERALVQFSSGATGDPKAVPLTHANLITNVRAIRRFLVGEGAPLVPHTVSWLPLHHDMGLVGAVLTALDHPASITLLPPDLFASRPALWLRAIARHRASVSAAPDFGYAWCVERVRDEEMEGHDLSGWCRALDGAETVSAATLRRFAARFARFGFRAEAFTPVYGLAEAALAVTAAAPGGALKSVRLDRAALALGRVVEAADGLEVVSVGRPLDGVEVRAPEGRVGPVLVRGASVMRGYLGGREADGGLLDGGWLDTGDLGFLRGGELHLCGRTRDLVILRGRNHPPQEFEQPLEAVEGLRPGGCAAFGHHPGDDGAERLVILVEARAPAADLGERCRSAVLRATGIDPAAVVFVAPGRLPRTSSGKVRRGEARRRWLDGTLADRSGATSGRPDTAPVEP
jgi:acyl-CoA synthetase (AMP-forming)/AMP-acid ligase II